MRLLGSKPLFELILTHRRPAPQSRLTYDDIEWDAGQRLVKTITILCVYYLQLTRLSLHQDNSHMSRHTLSIWGLFWKPWHWTSPFSVLSALAALVTRLLSKTRVKWTPLDRFGATLFECFNTIEHIWHIKFFNVFNGVNVYENIYINVLKCVHCGLHFRV